LFEIETPIYEGDVVEIDDPRGGKERRLAAEVRVNKVKGHPHMSRIKVIWGKALPPRGAPVRRLAIENLHPRVISASSDLLNDEHYASAVSEALKSIEVRVRERANLPECPTHVQLDTRVRQTRWIKIVETPGRSSTGLCTDGIRALVLSRSLEPRIAPGS
jgi:hypothetical protein